MTDNKKVVNTVFSKREGAAYILLSMSVAANTDPSKINWNVNKLHGKNGERQTLQTKCMASLDLKFIKKVKLLICSF